MEAGTVHHLGKNPPPPEALAEVLSTARAEVDREFQVTQFLDTKSRGLVTVGAQWFGIAQAVAAVAYATKKPETWMLWAVGAVALAGAVALGFLFFFSWQVWKTRSQGAVTPAGLLQMRDVVVGEGSATKLVDHYAARLQDRRAQNNKRADALSRAEIAWVFAMAVPAIELGLALVTRLVA